MIARQASVSVALAPQVEEPVPLLDDSVHEPAIAPRNRHGDRKLRSFILVAAVALPFANAQTGTQDQLSPATNAGFNGDAPFLIWQQEVQAGLSGTLEGFSLTLTGNVGAQLNVPK